MSPCGAWEDCYTYSWRLRGAAGATGPCLRWVACVLLGLGLINEVLPWDMPLWQQVVIGAGIITVLEFLTGCVVNLWLGWGVWDYSNKPGNILGQICPQFFLLWLPVSLAGIVLDDWLRYWWWGEERPCYKIL